MAIQLATTENYEDIIKEGFVIVDFFSETCVPCKAFSKVLDEIEYELPFVNIVKINTTKYPELGKKNKILGVPTIFFINDGKMLERHVGLMTEEEVKNKIEKFLYQ
jgi:thioredoxin 1